MRISDWSSDVCSSDLTGAVGGARYAETTLRLSRVIELGGKREARQALGNAEVLRQRNLADTAKLEIASRTTARYVAVAAAQQQLEFARERVKLAEQTRAEDRKITRLNSSH